MTREAIRGLLVELGLKGEGKATMTAPSQMKTLLDHLRQVPDARPIKPLTEFRRLVADDLKAEGEAVRRDPRC